MTGKDKPTIFIGSSAEARELTTRLADLLEASGAVTVLPWYNAFNFGFAAIEDLARRLDEVDFAAFVMRADDQVRTREQTQGVTRDNVVFELGLFMGKLNRDRTFALVEQGVTLPTDFKGVTHLPIGSTSSAEEPVSLEGPVAAMVKQIREHGRTARIPCNAHLVERGAEGRNTYDTITSALEVANPGDVILVRPGTYTEQLVIDKPVEIIGVGVLEEHQQAVVRTSDRSAIVYRAAGRAGRISTLTIEGGGGPGCAAVDVETGYLVLAGCHITSRGQAEACVRVRGDGRARIIANTITEGHGAGILICERGDAQVIDNLISRHAHSCVEIRDSTRPVITGNRIRNGRSGGVLIRGGSLARLLRNDIHENREAGIAVVEDADLMIKDNRIHDGFAAGIWIGKAGRGTISENDIYANRGTGVEIQAGGSPLVVNNRIYNGAGGGIVLDREACGRIEGNEVRGNQRAGVAFLHGAKPFTFSRNRIVDGRAEGVYDEIGVPKDDNDVERNPSNWVTSRLSAVEGGLA
jgi:parallel beta-helix repeat protein